MNFNQSTGIIEMFMDSLEITDEGTFTFNLMDGKATGTTSLVLIGDGKLSITDVLCMVMYNCVLIMLHADKWGGKKKASFWWYLNLH